MQAASNNKRLKAKNLIETNYTYDDMNQKSITVNLLPPKISNNNLFTTTILNIQERSFDQSLMLSVNAVNQLLDIPNLQRRNKDKNDTFDSIFKSSQLQKSSKQKINENLLQSIQLKEKPSYKANSNNIVQRQLQYTANSQFYQEPSFQTKQVDLPKDDQIKISRRSALKEYVQKQKLMPQNFFDGNHVSEEQKKEKQEGKIKQQENSRLWQKSARMIQNPRQVRNYQYVTNRQSYSPNIICNIQTEKKTTSRITDEKSSKAGRTIDQKLKLKDYMYSIQSKERQNLRQKYVNKYKQRLSSMEASSKELIKKKSEKMLIENRQIYKQITTKKYNLQNERIMPLLKHQILQDIQKAQRSLNKLYQTISSSKNDDVPSNTELIIYYQIRRTMKEQLNDNISIMIDNLDPYERLQGKTNNESFKLI